MGNCYARPVPKRKSKKMKPLNGDFEYTYAAPARGAGYLKAHYHATMIGTGTLTGTFVVWVKGTEKDIIALMRQFSTGAWIYTIDEIEVLQ